MPVPPAAPSRAPLATGVGPTTPPARPLRLPALAAGLIALGSLAAALSTAPGNEAPGNEARGRARVQPASAAGTAPDFAREVKPVLSRNCFACHGPDPEHREAGLRLDTFEGATALRDEVAAVAPGDLEASDLWHRIHDERRPMPPRDSGFSLTAAERDVLTRWIESGAEYEPHWSFTRVERPTPPEIAGAPADLHPIDAFVRARLADSGLRPSAEADRRSLARRLSLDLTGLPPAPERVERLVADEDPGALDAYVDELLASPHYGERWAALWLDLARYADSKGYGSDPLRSIWRWRDWVIEAFDQNLPFDRFTELQMAGDLLPEATWETRLATAFHRNTMVNTEGGTDNEEFRVAAVKDRANTTGQVWLGLTVGCAECHSHKFDPLSHEEYYAFYGLFDQTADRDANDDSPRIETPTAEQAARIAGLDARIAALDAELARVDEVPLDQLAAWVTAQNDRSAAVATQAHTEDGAALPQPSPGRFVRGADSVPERDVAVVELEATPELRSLHLRALADPALPDGGPGLSSSGNFVLTELRATAVPRSLALVHGARVRIQHHGPARILSLAEVEVFDGEDNVALGRPVRASSSDYGGTPDRAVDGRTSGRYEDGSVTHSRTEHDPWWEVDLGEVRTIQRLVVWNRTGGTLAQRLRGASVQVLDASGAVVWESLLSGADTETLVPTEGRRLRLEAVDASFAQDGWPLAAALDGDPRTGWAVAPRFARDHESVFRVHGAPSVPYTLRLELQQDYGSRHLLGTFELWGSSAATGRVLEPDERQALETAAAAGADPAGWPEEVRAALLPLARADSPAARERVAERERLRAERDGLEVAQTPVLVPLAADARRTTRILHKGNFLEPGEAVEPGVPAALGGAPVRDRRELARWLTSRDNPLTARVHVNRLWAQLFGTGLVETEEDFGAQGALPTHPLLLDWLAAEFMESGWDQQHVLRTIVSSATYRQSARVTPQHQALDPRNRLLARGPRFRLSAETVRDQALAVAGLLSPKKLGPSVFPPQPEGLWQAAFNGADRSWKTSTGEDRYRRGLYVFLRRSSPYPALQVFDAPTRETCTPRRIRTNTALQAFVTLNDPVYVEAAQALARRIVREAPPDDAARAAHGLLLCTQRPATDAEVDALVDLVTDERARFAARPTEALRFATDPLGPLDDSQDAVELATWTLAANVLLNLDEVLTKP